MTSDAKPIIEPAGHHDLAGILDILNHFILHDHCTFDTQPWSPGDKQAWFESFGEKPQYLLLVARQGDDILGYAHSGQWRGKRAYDVTVETTVYVAAGHAGRGLGRALLGDLLHRLEDTPARRAVAGVAQPNSASNRLHESLGFSAVGTFHGVGHKFGKFWDVRWFERSIP
jgi:phosphinothricin acetyltransferase